MLLVSTAVVMLPPLLGVGSGMTRVLLWFTAGAVLLALAATALRDPGIVCREWGGGVDTEASAGAARCDQCGAPRYDDCFHCPSCAVCVVGCVLHSSIVRARAQSSLWRECPPYVTAHVTFASVLCRRDHHCPWVGGCVGRGNASAFYTFFLACGAHFGLAVSVLSIKL
jgi:hypothetical protein